MNKNIFENREVGEIIDISNHNEENDVEFETLKFQKKQDILKQIKDLEIKCLRPLRENDKEYLDKYNNQILELRKQLQELNK